MKTIKSKLNVTFSISNILTLLFIYSISVNTLAAKSLGLHTEAQLEKAKIAVSQNSLQLDVHNKLIDMANRNLTRTHQAKTKMFMYDVYATLTEAQKEEIHAADVAATDNEYAYQLALAYKLTGNTQYADKAVSYLDAWATYNNGWDAELYSGTAVPDLGTYKTPGYFNRSGADMAMNSILVGFLQAAILLRDYSGWTQIQQDRFSSWIDERKVHYLRFFLPGNSLPTASTRYPVHVEWENPEWPFSNVTVGALMTQMMVHVWEQDTTTLAGYDTVYFKKMLDEQIRTLTDSGYNIPHMLPVETRRGNNAIWYTAWTLETMTGIMELLKNETGLDLFKWKNKHGSSVEDALSRFFIYVENPALWPWLSGTNGSTVGTISRIVKRNEWGGTTYEAMGIKYGKEEWTNWATANGASAFFGTSRITWGLSSLLQPSQIGQSDVSNTSITNYNPFVIGIGTFK